MKKIFTAISVAALINNTGCINHIRGKANERERLLRESSRNELELRYKELNSDIDNKKA